MISQFVAAWDARKEEVRAIFAAKHPSNYIDIVRAVVSILAPKEEYGTPDPERITQIDHGDYQGTLLFVIGAQGYQPSDFWFVKVYYGSCSGCDTLQAIQGYEDGVPSEDQVNQYMMLALHIVQGIKTMDGEPA